MFFAIPNTVGKNDHKEIQIPKYKSVACVCALARSLARKHASVDKWRENLTIGMDASDVKLIPKIAQFFIKRSNNNHIFQATAEQLNTFLTHAQK